MADSFPTTLYEITVQRALTNSMNRKLISNQVLHLSLGNISVSIFSINILHKFVLIIYICLSSEILFQSRRI